MSGKALVAVLAALTLGLFGLLVIGSGPEPADDNCLPTPGGGSLKASGSVVFPLREGTYQVSSPYGPRGGEAHQGVDLAAAAGTAIYSAADGTVAVAGPARGFGQWIVVDSVVEGQQISNVYGHMPADGVLVKTGDTVAAGQHIGNVGNAGVSSGPHLHFEVWQGTRLGGGKSADPMPWLSRAVSPPAAADSGVELVAASTPLPAGGGVGCGRPVGGSGLNVELLLADFPAAAPFVPWIQKFAGQCPETTAPIVAAQIRNESGSFQVNVTNPSSGAQGPTQFMPATWAAKGVDGDGDGKADPFSIADAVASQVAYDCELADLAKKDMTGGKVRGDVTELMLSYYNCGPGASASAGGVCQNTETQNYVKDIPKWAQKWSSPTGSTGGLFGDLVVDAARRWVGTPYAWGGGDENGPTRGIRDGGVADSFGDVNKIGFDCSGLVKYAVAVASGGAIILPHSDQSQIDSPLGTPITNAADLRPGDVIQPAPGHIFIWVGNGTVIEAPESGAVVKESHWEPPASGLKARRFR